MDNNTATCEYCGGLLPMESLVVWRSTLTCWGCLEDSEAEEAFYDEDYFDQEE